jgi:K+-sensing histidine kinase KdpD
MVPMVGMLERDQRLPADVRQDVAMIGRNVALETRLIDDLLDVTRITHGKVHLDRRPVDVSTVLSQAAEICDAELAAKG